MTLFIHFYEHFFQHHIDNYSLLFAQEIKVGLSFVCNFDVIWTGRVQMKIPSDWGLNATHIDKSQVNLTFVKLEIKSKTN